MNGHIRCSKCFKGRKESECPYCGYSKCYVDVYRNKKHWRYWKYYDGMLLDFERAERLLSDIRTDIDKKVFSPFDVTDEAISERRFSVQIHKWLNREIDETDEDDDQKEWAPETSRMYRSYTINHYLPFFDATDVRKIDDDMLEEFKGVLKRKEPKLRVRTRRNVLAILKVFFLWLRRKKVIKVMPEFPTVKGKDSSVKVALQLEEQIGILQKVDGKYRDVFEFAMETGLRTGELCAVKVKDLKVRQGLLLVQRTYSGHVMKENVTEENKRFIPLSDRAHGIALNHSRGKHPEAFLFINPDTGRGFKPNWISKVWRKYSDVTFYEASRHSFCTQIVEAGATEYEAQILMRHADPRSTQAYIHANVGKMKGLVNRRGEVLPMPEKGLLLNEY